jgi:hypothetical protein
VIITGLMNIMILLDSFSPILLFENLRRQSGNEDGAFIRITLRIDIKWSSKVVYLYQMQKNFQDQVSQE